jgi:hypothetical protein
LQNGVRIALSSKDLASGVAVPIVYDHYVRRVDSSPASMVAAVAAAKTDQC